MFKKVLVVLSFSASLSYAQAPGKAPDWWCRAEPISLNGDDYLEFGLNAEEACEKALKACEDHYPNCTIEGCGEWSAGLKNFDCYCHLTSPEDLERR